MTRDAIYARYSSHAQDQGTSIDVQIQACERAAATSCAHYIDRARTGRAMAGRDALRQMISDAESGQLDRVWLYKWDRLGRSHETHTIVADLEDLGIEVISATEGREQLSRGIQLVVAEHYSRALAERTRSGLQRRSEQGLWTGGRPPYGYSVVDGPSGRVLAINPQEADTVRLVFDLYVGGHGYKAIMHELEARCIRPRQAKRWSQTSIRGILTQPLVIGHWQFNRRRFALNRITGRRLPKANAHDQIQTYHYPELQIIEKCQFDLAQQIMQSRSRTQGRSSKRRIYPFTGLIRCHCGEPFYAQRSSNKKGEYVYYSCRQKVQYGHGACTTDRIREDWLMDMVHARILELIGDQEDIIEMAIEEARKLTDQGRRHSAELARQLREVDQRIDTLTRQAADPALAESEAARAAIYRQIGDAESERTSLHAAMAKLADQAHDNTDRLAQAVRETLADIRGQLAMERESAETRQLIERFVGPMRVQGDMTIVPVDPAENGQADHKPLIGLIVCAQPCSNRPVCFFCGAGPVKFTVYSRPVEASGWISLDKWVHDVGFVQAKDRGYHFVRCRPTPHPGHFSRSCC